jgi:plasmid stability protein
MKSITVSDTLHGRLAARAAAHQRSIEDEIRSCLELALQDDAAVDAIPEARWQEIETSLDAALRETPSDFTEQDREKYRDLARGYLSSQKS